MKNTQNLIITTVTVIVAIAGITSYAANRSSGDKKDNMNMKTSSLQTTIQPDTSSTDYKQFFALKGEEYDRLFLSNMIGHHQGAVDMANIALTTAKHQELKTLAQDIVTAQTSEISNMTDWQKTWGYPASSGSAMIDHSAMGMEDSNAGMLSALKNKTGDDFDKAFLEQMIMHHQAAINMTSSGTANAQHQEVKSLTVAIVTAQSKEILQMRQWQKDWSFKN